MNSRYQLVHPIIGGKIYETKSERKGAKKCYDEIKHQIGIGTFSVKNIDTGKINTYKVHKKYKHRIMTGGDGEDQDTNPAAVPADPDQSTIPTVQPTIQSTVRPNVPISKMLERLESLEARLSNIEISTRVAQTAPVRIQSQLPSQNLSGYQTIPVDQIQSNPYNSYNQQLGQQYGQSGFPCRTCNMSTCCCNNVCCIM